MDLCFEYWICGYVVDHHHFIRKAKWPSMSSVSIATRHKRLVVY